MVVDLLVLIGVAMALLAGGFAKGFIGFGMPLVSIPLVTLVVDVRVALALMTVPIFVSNIRQSFRGGLFGEILQRFWWLLIAMAAGFVIGGLLIVRLDSDKLLAVVGLMVMVFVLSSVFQPSLRLPDRLMRPVGLGAGLLGGVLGGLTTLFGPPLLMFLMATSLPRNLYVATIGAIWLIGGLLLIITYASVRILTLELAVYSLLCVIPALIGMLAGEWVRDRINQRVFRVFTLIALFAIGASMLRNAFV